MKKFTKLSLAALTALTLSSTSAMASEAEVSANVSMTSNYIWRGMTQADNSPAIQGGFDVAYGNFYAGTWASNAWDNIEIDYYAGYAGEIGGLSYDLGYCNFTYPSTDGSTFGEATVAVGYSIADIDLGAAYSVPATGEDFGENLELSASVMGVDLVYGDYGDTGTYYSASYTKSLGKVDLTLAYTGHETEDSRIVTSIGASF